MKKIILASVAIAILAGSSAVYAQYRPERGFQQFHMRHMRLNPDDMSAFADARIAAVKAGLRLTPDQEKNWPALEAAVKDFAKLRIDRAQARMKDRSDRHHEQSNNNSDQRDQIDPVAGLRMRADNMAATAAGLKRIVEAADPLYKSLDDGQKRRLAILTRMERRFGGGPRAWQEGRRGHDGFDRGSDDRDRGPDHDRGQGPDRL